MFVCIRLGDILFCFVQYSMYVQESEVDQYSTKIMEYYNKGLRYLEKSIYWFEVKDKISNQLDLQHLIDEYSLLGELTNTNYDERIKELKLRNIMD